jgi:hypothetical protein
MFARLRRGGPLDELPGAQSFTSRTGRNDFAADTTFERLPDEIRIPAIPEGGARLDRSFCGRLWPFMQPDFPAYSELLFAASATSFQAQYGFDPDAERFDAMNPVPDSSPYAPWAAASLALNNAGDELLLLDPFDTVMDAMWYGGGFWPNVAQSPTPVINEALVRLFWYYDTDGPMDFQIFAGGTPGEAHFMPFLDGFESSNFAAWTSISN